MPLYARRDLYKEAERLGLDTQEGRLALPEVLSRLRHLGSEGVAARRAYLEAEESERQADELEHRLSREQGW